MRPDHYKRRSKNYKKDGYSRDYERKRKNSGKRFKDGFKAILRMVRKFLKRNPEYESMLCALMAWLMMKRYSCSIRGMVEECDARPGLCKKLGLDHVPSKSWLHKHMGMIPIGLLDSLLTLTAGSDAYGTLSVDSTQYTYNRYVLAEDAKRGEYYKKATIKHHALISPNGRIVSSAVTYGNAGDSPMLEHPCIKTPRGDGHLLGDSAYCSKDNCELAIDLGRTPCMPAKENCLGNGNSPWARMIRWQGEHPGSFYRTYRKRNTIESCFSAIKDRFNFRVRSVTLEMQKRELAIMSICRNLFV